MSTEKPMGLKETWELYIYATGGLEGELFGDKLRKAKTDEEKRQVLNEIAAYRATKQAKLAEYYDVIGRKTQTATPATSDQPAPDNSRHNRKYPHN